MPVNGPITTTYEKWFDDVSERHLEGRFIDLEVDDPCSANQYTKQVKTVLAIEIRPRVLRAGSANSSCQRIKPHNEADMKRRFPDAWAYYEARKAGKPVKEERSTSLPWGVLSQSQINTLTANGYGSVERLLALSDHEVTAVLGPKGSDIRDRVRTELDRKEAARSFDRSAPSATPIEIKGPIDEMTLMILHSRSIMVYEELAGFSDSKAWSILAAKGEIAREFAREELRRRLTPIVAGGPLDARTIATLLDLGVTTFEQLGKMTPAHAGPTMLGSKLSELTSFANSYLARKTSGEATTTPLGRAPVS